MNTTKVDQFALPRGTRGRMAGAVMAIANADMERRAIGALELEGNERVLEIGFGPGVGVRYLRRRLPWGLVAGVDPSEVMVRQARRRNHRACRAGIVHLRIGDASHLAWPDARFDAVVSVNNVMLWDPLDACIAEVRRVMKIGGRLSIAIHDGAAAEVHDELVSGLWGSGFTSVRSRSARALSGPAVYITARAT